MDVLKQMTNCLSAIEVSHYVAELYHCWNVQVRFYNYSAFSSKDFQCPVKVGVGLYNNGPLISQSEYTKYYAASIFLCSL